MTPHRKQKNWLEWLVFTVGLVLVSAVVAYLVYDIATAPTGPSDVELQLGPTEQRSGRFVIPVEVINRGYEVAEGVEVEVALVLAGGKTERGRFVIQFLPREATRHGSVTFTSNPEQAAQVTARVLGYQRP